MKIDFSQLLLDMDRNPIEDLSKRKTDEEGKVKQPGPNIRLADICINVLTNFKVGPDKKELSGEDKLHYYVLACQIRESLEPGALQPDFKSKDVTLIKDLIGSNYAPIISGQAWQLIEPDEAKEKPKDE